MRFGPPPNAAQRAPTGHRFRLWLLVIALGLVLAAIRELQQPETIARLDQLFVPSQQQSTDSNTLRRKNSLSVSDSDDFGEFLGSPKDHSPRESAGSANSKEPFSRIEDNTYFRPEERAAWFAAFAELAESSSAELKARSLGEVTYAQLLQQPEVYRGKVVTLRGTVLREEVQQPSENPLGMINYHRLWLGPTGGGNWPFVVYCRHLPSDFPRGDGLLAKVEVEGIFFKNWSFAHDDGLGLAPVVLANDLRWIQSPKPIRRPSITLRAAVWGSVAAAVVALAVVWLALRKTARRPRNAGRLPATFMPPDAGNTPELHR